MSSCKTRDLPAKETKSLPLENYGDEKEVVSHDMCNEMTDAQRDAIVYRSKLLDKYFESYDDMLREEAEFNRVNEEKLKKAEEKRNDAKKVEDAYKNLLEVKSKAAKEIREAEQMYFKERNSFIEKHGSYHMTYTNVNGEDCLSVSDLVDSIWEAFGSPFKFLK